jgi:CBS-domain-containing membrane protein
MIIASFGASAFLAFTFPHKRRSRPRCLIGGYFIGVVVGCIIHYATEIPVEEYFALKMIHVFVGAFGVVLSMFLMSITDTEHPPAASIALGFVINDWKWQTIILVMTGIILISLIKEILKPHIIDMLRD